MTKTLLLNIYLPVRNVLMDAFFLRTSSKLITCYLLIKSADSFKASTVRMNQSLCELTPHERSRTDHVGKNHPVRITGGAVVYVRPCHTNRELFAR